MTTLPSHQLRLRRSEKSSGRRRKHPAPITEHCVEIVATQSCRRFDRNCQRQPPSLALSVPMEKRDSHFHSQVREELQTSPKSSIGKVLEEKVILTRLVEVTDENSTISDELFGFHPKHSTVDQLNSFRKDSVNGIQPARSSSMWPKAKAMNLFTSSTPPACPWQWSDY
jgi:hypothetical protein